MNKVALSLAPLLIATASAHAADQFRTVPTGKNQRIDVFASVNSDCTSMDLPTVRRVDPLT